MASNTMRGVTRCRVCGAHLAIEHALAYCINRRCRARSVHFHWEYRLPHHPGNRVFTPLERAVLDLPLNQTEAMELDVSRETLLTKSEEKAPVVESAA